MSRTVLRQSKGLSERRLSERRSTARRLAAASATALLLTACGGGSGGADSDTAAAGSRDGESETTYGCGETPLKVAMILPGPVSDGGYNAAAAAGMKQAEEKYCIESAISENVPLADEAKVTQGYAADGFDVIIGHGEHNQNPMDQVSRTFPDVRYFVHAGDLEGNGSVASSYLATEEPGYLEGLVAARLTKTKKIGFIGYTPIAVIVRAMNALEKGAQSVDPSIKVDKVFTNSLVDPSATRQAANALLANGNDVLPHVNGGPNAAEIFKAAQEKGAKAMGWPVDQNKAAPDTVATSITVNYPKLILEEIGSVVDGSFKGGVTRYGIASGVVGIAPLAAWVPAEAKADVEAAMKQIESGELTIDVPGTLDK
jgi:basic membrane protein A